jgi:serine/threonine protein kinase
MYTKRGWMSGLRPTDDATTGTSTAHGLVMGTLAYMAPEQLAGREVDARTDVYSLGVMLVEVLTGERRLSALDPRRPAALAAWAERVDLPASHRAGLVAVVRRCVAHDPLDRFASAEELAERLLPALR